MLDVDDSDGSSWRAQLPATWRWRLGSLRHSELDVGQCTRHRANVAWFLLRSTVGLLGAVHRSSGGVLPAHLVDEMTRYNAPWGTWLAVLEHLSTELAEIDASDPFHPLVSAFVTSEHRDALQHAVNIRNRFVHGSAGELPVDKGELAALGEGLMPLLRQGSLAFRALCRYRVVVPVDEGLSGGHARTSLRVLVGEEPLQVHVEHDERLVLRTPWLLSRQGRACRLDPWVALRPRGRGWYVGVFARCTRSRKEADYSGQEEEFRAPWTPPGRVPPERVPIRLPERERRRVFGRLTGGMPEEVEDWQVVAELGRGSSAVVYAVRHRTTGDEAALKLIHAGQEASPLVQERWRREIDAMQRICHPGVVRLLGEVTWQGRMGLLMERVKGESLTEHLRAEGLLSASRVARLGVKLLDALAAAHAAGVIHRDIKPSNILICEQGEVRLVDFGIARLADSETLTGTMDVVGTLHYLAPEQISRQTVDERTDLFAVGRVLRECLGAGAVPPRLDACLRRATRDRPADRFGSAMEMAESLGRPDLLDGDACPVDVGDEVAGFSVARVDQSLEHGVWLLRGRRQGVKDAPEAALVTGFSEAARARLNQRAVTLTDWEKRAVGFDHWSHRDNEPVVISLISPSPLKMAQFLLGQGDLADASPRRPLGATPKIEKVPPPVSERQAAPEAQVRWDEAETIASEQPPPIMDERRGSGSSKVARRWPRRLSGVLRGLSRRRRDEASGSPSQGREPPRRRITWEFVPPATEEAALSKPSVERPGREGVAWVGCLVWLLLGVAFGAGAILVLWGGVFRWLAADPLF